MKTLTFGIDYDDTITADVETFGKLISEIYMSGHQVVVVTGRSDIAHWGDQVRATLLEIETARHFTAQIPVVFAGMVWKREAARNAGYAVDIWIDNSPEYIDRQHLLKYVPAGMTTSPLSPETNGRIKKGMTEAFEGRAEWKDVRAELYATYPKRVTNPVIKSEMWNNVDSEAKEKGLEE